MDERTLCELLECSVCLERLDTTSKVLPCQHTFCRQCLEVIVLSHSELRCPECRVLVDTKIDDLPPNVLLMRILEGMKNATASTTQANNHSANQAHITNNSTSSNDLISFNGKQMQEPSAAGQSGNVAGSDANESNGITNIAFTRDQVQHKRPANNQENCPRNEQMLQQQQQHHHLHQQQQQQQQIILKQSDETNAISMCRGWFKPKTCGLNQPQQQREIMRQPHPQQQQNLCNKQTLPTMGSVPHAEALYNFDSKEPGDLIFKKGDKINLRRRIDVNWYIGECSGREGVFPINYVHVITPLPLPQCKALYDFRMGPNEEEGCLTFKKGAIINVFRRVDQNWAEGKLGDCIGIFPIAFVEMNALAKQLMDVSTKYIHYAMSPRSVPPTPNDQQHSNFSSDSSSTLTTSPNSSTTSNTSSSNSSTAPNSPTTNQQPPNGTHLPSVSSQTNEKRYSLNVANATTTENGANSIAASNSNQNSSSSSSSNRHAKDTLMSPNEKVKEKTPRSKSGHQRHHSPSTSYNPSAAASSSSTATNLPNVFVALYPYKPTKPDELELKKGAIYYVKERCQDGWFKGTNRAQKSGVFPGNYVAPLRNPNDGSTASNANPSSNHNKRFSPSSKTTGECSASSGASHKNGTSSVTTLPELPPRTCETTTSSSSVWSKPIGQHVEAFFSRKSSQQPSSSSTSTSRSEANKEVSQSNGKKEQNLSSAITSSATVNLIKRFTNMKRSKSPTHNQSAPSYSMDNPVFEDNIGTVEAAGSSKRNTIHLSHPVHVRSGSCPSQLLTSLPVEISMGSSSGAQTKAEMFGSHRIKGHKERPALHGMRHGMEAASRMRSSGETANAQNQHMQQPSQSKSSSSYHRKSQSLDAATISAQIVNSNNLSTHTSDAAASNAKPKTYSHNERFRCIVSYPPNSEYELELAVGDIIFVHKKRENGWYKGTHARTGKVGLFPSSFVEPDI